jgi:hypothetical protein
MITRIELANPQREATPNLVLGNSVLPHEDSVQIFDIDGLGPVNEEISSSPYATRRGEFYQGSSTGKRNIVLTLGLNPNWIDQTISSLRKLLYVYLMPGQWVKLRLFSDDYPPVQITGKVESFNPNMFSKDPETQVSVICPKPDFIAVDSTIITGRTSDDEVVIEYTGNVETGFELRARNSPDLGAYTGDLFVRNQTLGKTETFHVVDVTVDSGRSFMVNTVKTSRKVQNIYDNGVANILPKMSLDSEWPELYPGENVLSVSTTQPGLDWLLGYFNRYGGL